MSRISVSGIALSLSSAALAAGLNSSATLSHEGVHMHREWRGVYSEQAREAPPVTKTVLHNLPERRSFKAAAVGGKVYVFDYEDDELTRSEDLSARGSVYACDPASANWQTRAKMPVKKSNYSLVSFNDRVYVIGGFTGPNVPSSSVEEYDPQSDRWILRKSMPTARGRIGVGCGCGRQVLRRGRGYVHGCERSLA